jgi:putative salt-induced outer membrane protein YdiY
MLSLSFTALSFAQAEPNSAREPALEVQTTVQPVFPPVEATDHAPVEAELTRLGLLGDAAQAAAEEAAEPKEWKSKFVVALTGSFGNVDTQSFTANVTSVREKDVHKTTLDAAYYYGASNGDRTDNKFTAGARHDWSVRDTPWFWFAQARYDYDEFQSWEHRISFHIGPGYKIIDRDDFKWSVRGGLGAIKEFGSDNEDWRLEALIGTDVDWKITETQNLKFSSTVYPDLNEAGEFRWTNALDWSVLLDKEANMSLTAGLRHEHQSQVSPGREHDDLKVFAGLQFDF